MLGPPQRLIRQTPRDFILFQTGTLVHSPSYTPRCVVSTVFITN